MPELLLEVGCAELPASFVDPALDDLKAAFVAALDGLRLTVKVDEVVVEGTPRRLVLSAQNLPAAQQSREVIVHGPPARAAYTPDGTPTRAALGFAQSQGVEPSALFTTTTDRGEYVAVKRLEKARPTRELLGELLPQVLSGLRFPKSMRWSSDRTAFARPVHWLLAVFDGEVLPIAFAGIQSTNRTRGHRFLAPVECEVTDFEGYVTTLRQACVIVRREERRTLIQEQLVALAEAAGGRIVPMPALIDEVLHLVEWPHGILGRFDEALLELPREVLISEMVEHQRYFPLEDATGNALLPAFVAVSNTKAVDDTLVARGYARVLAARFDDARFFFAEDRKRPLESRIPDLQAVIFQRKLGTLHDKAKRIESLGLWLCNTLKREGIRETVSRAAWLAKADLTTQMVGEFPELQGTMGGYYATASQEPEVVATAIREHYLPRGSGDDLPATDVGAIVGIADRMDTLAGILGIGKAPTGSADPFALRRAALGVIRIILHRGFRLRLYDLAARAVSGVSDKISRPAADVERDVADFIRTRFKGVLSEQLRTDVADAVLGDGDLDVVDVDHRGRALSAFQAANDFEACATAFKRVANITRGRTADTLTAVNEDLFEAPAERALHEAIQALSAEVEPRLSAEDYAGAVQLLGRFRPSVDAFFDHVFVMVDDRAVQENRLRLLTSIARLFDRIADFTKLAV